MPHFDIETAIDFLAPFIAFSPGMASFVKFGTLFPARIVSRGSVVCSCSCFPSGVSRESWPTLPPSGEMMRKESAEAKWARRHVLRRFSGNELLCLMRTFSQVFIFCSLFSDHQTPIHFTCSKDPTRWVCRRICVVIACARLTPSSSLPGVEGSSAHLVRLEMKLSQEERKPVCKSVSPFHRFNPPSEKGEPTLNVPQVEDRGTAVTCVKRRTRDFRVFPCRCVQVELEGQWSEIA
eukprot:2114867-Rhodomonas_salina.1